MVTVCERENERREREHILENNVLHEFQLYYVYIKCMSFITIQIRVQL